MKLAGNGDRAPGEGMGMGGSGGPPGAPSQGLRLAPAPEIGAPFGKAHAYWRNHGYGQLTDRYVVDFVNVRFLSDHYRRPVQEVIVYRDRGSSFYRIQQRCTASPSPNRRTARPPGPGVRAIPAR